ncbi:MAG TPA: TonB family protein [Nitrospirota bacterium]|nr:TonB family protein [Nitrospirota bacterium]
MRLLSGKRIGQSGYELTLAIFFSFFIHAAIVAAALFLYTAATPKMSVPPYYSVKLVRLSAEVAPTPVQHPAPLVPPTPAAERKAEPKKAPSLPQPALLSPPSPAEEGKAEPKTATKAALKAARTTAKSSAMPEFSDHRQKSKPEETKPSESSEGQTQKATGGPPGVAVTTPQEEFTKFSWYVASVRDKIGQNWRPPMDSKDAKARVIFEINRSGWVLGVSIDTDHSSGATIFMQAAIRAIQSSNPFPPLPEDFGKQTLEFSVDLMAK